MLPSAFALHCESRGVSIPQVLTRAVTLLLLTVFNPHTIPKEGPILLNPLLWILRGEVAIYFAAWLVTQILNVAITTLFASRVPGMFLGVPTTVGWQTIGPCRLYLHLKSSQWDSGSTIHDYPETAPMPDASARPEVSSTWSSARSIQPSVMSPRRRLLRAAEHHGNLDPSIHGEAIEVLLDEGLSDGEQGS
ncbi:hypothetical protein CALVIDRAFT_120500 [Calocera viscosa TUFC12733]|uniref:Uncharacterized protein n=1 Tax=Calocera viscosa (strain TUFC12733) TaxID=1330018 RepID=A0A167MAF6_CALVF|nr:hypothetical protein CALVIDRAFT_120500 [Calocera viscosa TUFC12733]